MAYLDTNHQILTKIQKKERQLLDTIAFKKFGYEYYSITVICIV